MKACRSNASPILTRTSLTTIKDDSISSFKKAIWSLNTAGNDQGTTICHRNRVGALPQYKELEHTIAIYIFHTQNPCWSTQIKVQDQSASNGKRSQGCCLSGCCKTKIRTEQKEDVPDFKKITHPLSEPRLELIRMVRVQHFIQQHHSDVIVDTK